MIHFKKCIYYIHVILYSYSFYLNFIVEKEFEKKLYTLIVIRTFHNQYKNKFKRIKNIIISYLMLHYYIHIQLLSLNLHSNF